MAPQHCLRLAGLAPVSGGKKKRQSAEKNSMVSAAGS